MSNLKTSLTIILGLTFTSLSLSQESLNSSGGTASGIDGSVSYSIGQVVISSSSDTAGSLNQGVQQPYQIEVVSTPKIDPEISISVYPNPILRIC